MKQLFLLAIIALCCVVPAWAQPKAEVRAVWLTTNSNLDWPSKSTLSESQMKAELTDILDRLKEANFNTILFQAQVKGDVAWESEIQPAMRALTGNGANRMSWDVSKYVIEECHKRGMECHAWIVPYRVGTASEAAKYDNNPVKHVVKLHPELCVLYNNAYYLDPGLPEVRSYLVELYREVVTNYDYDGYNFDYTRYPGSAFGDDESYAKYGGGMSLADWRRLNINTFVHEFYDMVKSIKPDVKVGAAPIGTYKNVNGTGNMSAYSDVYQDACEWMQAGKHDLLVPQMYWNEKYGFSTHMTTWVENGAGRQIVVGLAPYKMLDSTNNWEYTVVTDQIEKVRNKEGMSGVCFFRAMNILGTETKVQQLYAALRDDYFKYPAHIPAMDYNGVTKPNAPIGTHVSRNNGIYTISWEKPALNEKDIKYYCVYASESETVDIADIKNCVGFALTDTKWEYATDKEGLHFAVTAFDTNYYESDAAMASVDGIDESLRFSIGVSNGALNIVAVNDIASVEVFDLAGRASGRTKISGRGATVENLAHAMYLVVATDCNGNIFSQKISI